MSKPVRRALVSVYNKEGVVEFCEALSSLNIEILSSGGTARILQAKDIPVKLVSEHTGFPEMLDGRVKTLHPRIHAGILAARDNPQHMKDLEQAGIPPIELIVVNLYPFKETAAIEGIGLNDVVEMIDIGGPTMVRAAAKNFAHTSVVVEPADYSSVIEELRGAGQLSDDTRKRLAVKAFRHTASYDNAVYTYLDSVGSNGDRRQDASAFDESLQLEFLKVQDLRYGENPHQQAAFYREVLGNGPSLATARQLQGKELSFNNILDFDAALGLVAEFPMGACAVIKHGNPCGVARATEPLSAFTRALACDPLSAFGGVIAFNRPVDRRAAESIVEQFYEGVIAPKFDEEARIVFKKKKKLRLLETGPLSGSARSGRDIRRVSGGILVQDWDRLDESVRESKVATSRTPSEEEWRALEFGWTVAKHVKSNAIVYAQPDRTVGIGAGQMSRVDSARIGAMKAQVSLDGAAMASDAFFPFRDGIDEAAKVGIRAVVQPGGSIRDDEIIEAANEHGIAMVLTGRRHFRH